MGNRNETPNISVSGTELAPTPVGQSHRRIVHSQDGDVEETATHDLSRGSIEDPYNLSSKIISAKEIQRIEANTRRKRWGKFPAKNNVGDFYNNQNESIQRLLKPVDQHVQDAEEEQSKSNLKYKIAVWGSLGASFVLAGLQLYGAISSGSLSIVTTMADSILDPISNTMLLLSHKAINRVDPHKFPSGRARIETVGNITFSFVMCTVSLIIIVVSILNLVEGSDTPTLDFHLPAVIAVSVAFVTKLALFLYCFALKNTYSQVQILWQDHRNDLFINGFGILTSVGGSKLRWWIDAMGATILSFLIAGLWSRTAWKEFQLLIGVSADREFQQLITYISVTHSPSILQVDTVRAYHSGPRLVVEVDIVMSRTDTLKHTHDVSEELQTKLESLPDVERAYVHVDYETSHKPEHQFKKQQ